MNYPSYIPGCGRLEEGAESDTIRLSGRRMVQVDAGPGEQSIEPESAPRLAPQKQRGPAIHARTVQRPDRRTRSCEISYSTFNVGSNSYRFIKTAAAEPSDEAWMHTECT